MPLARIDLIKGKPAEYRQTIFVRPEPSVARRIDTEEV
jgi:hypothetical protein